MIKQVIFIVQTDVSRNVHETVHETFLKRSGYEKHGNFSHPLKSIMKVVEYLGYRKWSQYGKLSSNFFNDDEISDSRISNDKDPW